VTTTTTTTTTAGRSNLTQGCIAVARGSIRRIRQVASMCTPSNSWFSGSHKFTSHTASRSVPPFSQGSCSRSTNTGTQTDRLNDHATYVAAVLSHAALRCGLIIVTEMSLRVMCFHKFYSILYNRIYTLFQITSTFFINFSYLIQLE